QEYLQAVAPVYGIEGMVPSAGGEALTGGDTPPGDSQLELSEEKEVMGTTPVSYQQTYRGLPVWEAGVNVTIQPQPMRVTASQSSVHQDVSVTPPDNLDEAAYGPGKITPAVLKRLLGLKQGEGPSLNGTRALV